MLIKGDNKQVVYKTRRELLGFKCDICKRELRFNDNSHVIKYFDVTTYHNDKRGLEEYRTICPECIAEFTTDYLANCSDTASIAIEATCVYEGQFDWD